MLHRRRDVFAAFTTVALLLTACGLRPADRDCHRDDAGDGRGHGHAFSVAYPPAAGAKGAYHLPGRRA